MSVQALAWVLDFSEAGGNDRLVMMTLGHYADNDGYVAKGSAAMARETRLADITVKRILNRLIETDELEEVEPSRAPHWWHALRADRRPRIFRLVLFALSRPGAATGVHGDTPRGGTPRGGATGARRGRDGGATGSTAPPLTRGDAPQSLIIDHSSDTASREADSEESPTPPPWLAAGITYQEWVDRGRPGEVEAEGA